MNHLNLLLYILIFILIICINMTVLLCKIYSNHYYTRFHVTYVRHIIVVANH